MVLALRQVSKRHFCLLWGSVPLVLTVLVFLLLLGVWISQHSHLTAVLPYVLAKQWSGWFSMLEQVCYVSLIVFISYVKDTSYFGFKAAVSSLLNGFVFYRWEWLLYTFQCHFHTRIQQVLPPSPSLTETEEEACQKKKKNKKLFTYTSYWVVLHIDIVHHPLILKQSFSGALMGGILPNFSPTD